METQQVIESTVMSRFDRVRSFNPALSSLSPAASIFNTARDLVSTSPKYAETNDLGVVEAFNSLGWGMVKYKEQKRQKRNEHRVGTQKYMAIYENSKHLTRTNEGTAQLIQIGSSDGTKPLLIRGGFYRFACSNGLIVGNNAFEPIKVIHRGQEKADKLISFLNQSTDTLVAVFDKIEEYMDIQLTEDQAMYFAKLAIQKRFGDKTTVDPKNVLNVRREADRGRSLWTTLNVVQENLVNPEFNVTTENNKQRKARKISGIDTSLKVNTALWDIAEIFVN